MANKTINGRIQQKHDTEVNWTKAANFIPKAGEVIVYDRDGLMDVERIKVGDGIHTANELPFIFEPVTRDDIDAICGMVHLISFSVDDVIYQAVDGMNWYEWVHSSYNTNHFQLITGTEIRTSSGKAIKNSSTGIVVTSDALIKDNNVYISFGAAEPE